MSARPRFLCLGTHHKTGTVWMRRTFRKWTDPAGVPVVRVGPRFDPKGFPQSGPALCVNWQSLFPGYLFDDPRARFLHVIRDPRDILISGARYHVTASLNHEKWLGRPRPVLGGRSYQDHIRSLPDGRARLLFEMKGKHRETLDEMLAWPYGHPSVIDLRFEDLIEDRDCALFRAALVRADVEGFDIDGLVQSYWQHSLFGGLADRDKRSGTVKRHIKSGRAAQWKAALPRDIAKAYADQYGDALITLGYEKDHSWVDQCPAEVEGQAA